MLAVKKLNDNRSASLGYIPSELLKIYLPEIINAIHKILIKIWIMEKIPTEWEKSSICLAFKKGNQLECLNYKCITFLKVAYKVFSNILHARLLPFTNKETGNYRCGFTVSQIQVLKQIFEKTKGYNIKT